jgi:pimeloyl-ACP methyl ester carboxylesterase
VTVAAASPTVVLVHGAFTDASCWFGVAAELLEAGIDVCAPPNPLRGAHPDSAYLASFVTQIDGPVLLVGHSYGGVAITRAATAAPNVVGLVYVAAFAPDEGETILGHHRPFSRERARIGPASGDVSRRRPGGGNRAGDRS